MTADDPRPAGEAPDLMAALRRSIERPRPAASGDATGGERETRSGFPGGPPRQMWKFRHEPPAPVASQADGDRERLAAALAANEYRPATHAGILAALLPVVRALVAEAAVDALMWSALTVQHFPGIQHQAKAVSEIRARAAALRAATTEDGTA